MPPAASASDGGHPATATAAAVTAAATAAPRAWQGRASTQQRQRLQFLLLLHAAWLAALTLLLASGIHGRRQRALLTARQLLGAAEADAGSGGSTAPAVSAPQFSAQRCGEAIALPQVALLFLVNGSMPHEVIWRLWLQSAAGLLPAEPLAGALCGGPKGSGSGGSSIDGAAAFNGSVLQALRSCVASSGGSAGGVIAAGSGALDQGPSTEQPASSGSGSRVLQQQALFDIYVHPHPDFLGYPPGSIFHGTELPRAERVTTAWGEHSLVDAERALLAAAYRNPRNRKFVLLSETDLPLYSPHLFYLQLLGERRSRINACNTTRGWDLFPGRWVPRMQGPRLKRHHWRKSWQWFALSRRHVGVVLEDREVDASFRAHCNTTFEADRGEERECYSDEHYFSTLLAVRGLDHETDCQGWLTDTDWKRVPKGTAHPWHYEPGEVAPSLVHRLRRPELPGCRHASTAAATARAGFVPAAALSEAAAAAGAASTAAAAAAAAAAAEEGSIAGTGAGAGDELAPALRPVCQVLQSQQQQQRRQRHLPLGPQCRLLARKFLPHTAEAALAALAPCDSSALVMNAGICPGETEQQAAWRRRRQRAAPVLLLASGAALAAVGAALLLGALPVPRAVAQHSGGGSRRREHG